jgi:hypothetical protein
VAPVSACPLCEGDGGLVVLRHEKFRVIRVQGAEAADFPAFWEAVMAGLLLIGAIVLVETNIKEVREINLFALVLVIQSLPFVAAVMLALIERSPLNEFATWRELQARTTALIARRPALTDAAPAPAPVQKQTELVQ